MVEIILIFFYVPLKHIPAVCLSQPWSRRRENTTCLMHIIMVQRHTGKAGFHNGQRVPEPVFIPLPWAPYKQEPIFLADKPWYTP